ncbi:MAG: hypothetical protein JXQ90_14365 [Cyclobacteriaceae bacterium]
MKTVSDEELRALVALQAWQFYEKHGASTFPEMGSLYTALYYGKQGLLRQNFAKQNPDFGATEVSEKSDAAFNQYLHPQATKGGHIAIQQLSFDDNKSLLAVDAGSNLVKWDLENRSVEIIYQDKKTEFLAVVEDAFVVVANNKTFKYSMRDPGTKPTEINSHTGLPFAFTSDGKALYSIGMDKKLFRYENDEPIEISRFTAPIKSLDASPDGNVLAVGSPNGDVVLMNLNDPNYRSLVIYRRSKENLPVSAVRFSPDGRFLAIGGSNYETGRGYIMMWDLENQRQFGPDLTGFGSEVSSIAFSPDGSRVAAGSRDKTARIWYMDSDKIYNSPIVLDDHGEWVLDVEFHPDGQSLFTASGDGKIRRFPLNPVELSLDVCLMISRNLSKSEWRQFVGPATEFPYEETCPGKPAVE